MAQKIYHSDPPGFIEYIPTKEEQEVVDMKKAIEELQQTNAQLLNAVQMLMSQLNENNNTSGENTSGNTES